MHARVCVRVMHACAGAPSCLCRCACVCFMHVHICADVCVHEYVCRGQRFLSAVCFNHPRLDMYEAESLT